MVAGEDSAVHACGDTRRGRLGNGKCVQQRMRWLGLAEVLEGAHLVMVAASLCPPRADVLTRWR